MSRSWRTNIGLRLPADVGKWLERHCERENRTFANYVETLILRDMTAISTPNPEQEPS